MKQIVITLVILVMNVSVYATVYYSDPVNGSMSNPGTSTQPWANLETIFNSGQTFNMGDVILLRNGNHGFPKINGVNTAVLIIYNQLGQKVYQTNLKEQSQLLQPKLSQGAYQIVVIFNNQKIFKRLIIE